MRDIIRREGTSRSTGEPPKQTYSLREMVRAQERASTQRRRETVANPEMCQFEYERLSSRFEVLKRYVDSEDNDLGNVDVSLFKDQISASVETLYRSDQSNPRVESLKAIQSLKGAAYEFRKHVQIAGKLAQIFERLDQTWAATQPDVPSSPHDKGKGRATSADQQQERDGQEPPLDVPQHPEPTDRFGNQAITEIFPKLNWDGITDPTERKAYEYVLSHYVRAFHEKAVATFQEDPACQNILQNYDASQIYYKFYGASSGELTQLVAGQDIHEDTIGVGPSKYSLRQFGMHTLDQFPDLYPTISIQKVRKYLQDGRSVQFATYDVAKPVYKKKADYRGKSGHVGLYLTDNHIQLAQEFGGNQRNLSTLYNVGAGLNNTGPWTLPDGAVKIEPLKKEKWQQDRYSTQITF